MNSEIRRNMPLFPIGIVMKLTDLTARQIRYYEQHGLVSPERTAGNQRLFSFNDVERLLEIKALIEQGVPVSGIKQMLEPDRPTSPGEADGGGANLAGEAGGKAGEQTGDTEPGRSGDGAAPEASKHVVNSERAGKGEKPKPSGNAANTARVEGERPKPSGNAAYPDGAGEGGRPEQTSDGGKAQKSGQTGGADAFGENELAEMRKRIRMQLREHRKGTFLMNQGELAQFFGDSILKK